MFITYCLFYNYLGFGMTESSPVTHFQPDEGAILGGCGVPIPNTIAKIIDIDTGKTLGPNEVSSSIQWKPLTVNTVYAITFTKGY